MDPLSLAMMGGPTILSGIGSWISGNKSAKAAEEAARMQREAEKEAISDAKNAGAKYQTDLTGYANAFDPYISGGGRATNQLYALLGLSGQDAANTARETFQTSPGYDFQMDQGIGALDRSAAARGMLNSGRQSKDLMRFGQGLANQDYRNYLSDLTGLGNQGYSATGAKTSTLAQGAGGPLQGGMAAANLAFKSAGTIPQGMIASQNAENAGLMGALGAANYGSGQFQGMQGMQGQDQLSKLLGNTSRGSSFNPNFGFPGSAGAIY